MSAHRAQAALSAAQVDAGSSREGAPPAVANAPALSPETAPPEIFCILVWMHEDLDEPLESSGEGKLTQGAGCGRLSELFFVGEIEP
jgi:hypothetical protein